MMVGLTTDRGRRAAAAGQRRLQHRHTDHVKVLTMALAQLLAPARPRPAIWP